MRKMNAVGIAVLLLALAACQAKPTVPENDTAVKTPDGEAELVGELPKEDDEEMNTEEAEAPTEEAPKEEDTTVETADWKQTYASALWIYAAGEQYTDECRFALAYIDEDDIPELVISTGDKHMDGVEIYTYFNGGLVNVAGEGYTHFGEYGGFLYMEKQNRFFNTFLSNGVSVFAEFRIENGQAVEGVSYYDTEGIGGDEVEYRINGEVVGVDEYRASLDAFNAGITEGMIGFDRESAYEFTSENYVAVFGN